MLSASLGLELGPTFTIVVEAPRFAHQVGRKLRGLLSRWVSLGLNDLRSPPTLSNDSRDTVCLGGAESTDQPVVVIEGMVFFKTPYAQVMGMCE